MSPITHFLASWTLADVGGLRRRDQALVAWSGVLPDADGLGVVVDGANRLLGRPDSWLFGEYHHGLLHGLLGSIAIPALLSYFAARRARVFVLGLVAVHLHLLSDLVGSRGPGIGDVWPIRYLAPFSDRLSFQWAGQWPLNGWPNILFTVLLLAYAFGRAIVSGYSPVGVFSRGADHVFVTTVQRRWLALRSRAPSRAA
jgi:hypothetical protein